MFIRRFSYIIQLVLFFVSTWTPILLEETLRKKIPMLKDCLGKVSLCFGVSCHIDNDWYSKSVWFVRNGDTNLKIENTILSFIWKKMQLSIMAVFRKQIFYIGHVSLFRLILVLILLSANWIMLCFNLTRRVTVFERVTELVIGPSSQKKTDS